MDGGMDPHYKQIEEEDLDIEFDDVKSAKSNRSCSRRGQKNEFLYFEMELKQIKDEENTKTNQELTMFKITDITNIIVNQQRLSN